MTKLADLRVLSYEDDGMWGINETTQPATVDDLVEVLADPEVQEALGADFDFPYAIRWCLSHQTTLFNPCGPGCDDDAFVCPAAEFLELGHWPTNGVCVVVPVAVVPLSRLEDTK